MSEAGVGEGGRFPCLGVPVAGCEKRGGGGVWGLSAEGWILLLNMHVRAFVSRVIDPVMAMAAVYGGFGYCFGD